MKNILSVTEARKQIFKLVEDVNTKGQYFYLTEKGRAKAVLMSVEEFESWKETIEVYRDIPNLSNDFAEAERAIKSGEYKNYVTLDEVLAKQGFYISDKSKKYDVSTKISSRSKKRTK